MKIFLLIVGLILSISLSWEMYLFSLISEETTEAYVKADFNGHKENLCGSCTLENSKPPLLTELHYVEGKFLLDKKKSYTFCFESKKGSYPPVIINTVYRLFDLEVNYYFLNHGDDCIYPVDQKYLYE